MISNLVKLYTSSYRGLLL